MNVSGRELVELLREEAGREEDEDEDIKQLYREAIYSRRRKTILSSEFSISDSDVVYTADRFM